MFFVSPITKTCTVPVQIGTMVYNRVKARRAGRQTSAQPGRAGIVERMILSTVGAALHPNLISLFQLAAQVPSNKINATESTDQLIWTALVERSPGRQSWVGLESKKSPVRTAENHRAIVRCSFSDLSVSQVWVHIGRQ